MFERFTPRARRVIVLAQDAAREMGHSQIKPDHLLIGLQQGEGLAADAMNQAGMDGTLLRQNVAARNKTKAAARKMDRVPFSVEAKKCLELSLRAALALGHNYIGTEHLFFGVEREAEARGESLDDLLGVRAADVHNRLTEILDGASAGPAMRSPGLQSVLDRARRQAGPTPMTTGHVLAAMLADTESLAGRALTSLGIATEAVQAALDAINLADTSDASPAPQSVAITIGETTTLIDDPEMANALLQLGADELRDAIKRAIGLEGPDQAAG
jgi:ATP-dependent Clp protease ATP-binding subunit ClpA